MIPILLLTSAMLAPAVSTPVQLAIEDGRVWLTASDATVPQILAAWTRVGQTDISNADRAPGDRVTLQLAGVPEEQVMELLLRPASGFVALTRTVADIGANRNRSRFVRIIILPSSSAPPAPPVRPIVGPDGRAVADDQGAQQNAPGLPRPVTMPRGLAVPPQVEPPPQVAAPPLQPAPPGNATPSRVPVGAPGAPSGVPVGVPVGVPTPGMIVPAPAQPGPPRRSPAETD
ncbi:MAG TPA: hypothetical protein VGY48_11060 [Vicinamibacterales bacterium]|nr:hypothetical protein [Vicinamibacterales bacterium]